MGWIVTAADVIDAEDAERLWHRMQTLPSLTRRVVVLRKVNGLDQHEIAARLDISTDDVMNHLVAAIRACADLMEVADA